jgi:tellurite resistance protein TerC
MHVNELPFINNGEHIEWAPEISTWMSLGVIIVAMTVATIASLVASARDKRRDEAVARAESKAP